MRILMVEDDRVIAEGLRFSLEQEGYEVSWAGTVAEALGFLEEERGELPDICLLDLMLPDGSGYEVCRAVRKKSKMPILFLTACDDEVNTVMALEQGADDYIAKPFRVRELLARIRAILRRAGEGTSAPADTVTVGDCQVNIKTGKVYAAGREIALTAMEYKLLLVFLNNPGQTLSRQQILDSIWDGAGDFVNDNTLTVYIRRLRGKLGDGEEGRIIKTVRGIGYRMER